MHVREEGQSDYPDLASGLPFQLWKMLPEEHSGLPVPLGRLTNRFLNLSIVSLLLLYINSRYQWTRTCRYHLCFDMCANILFFYFIFIFNVFICYFIDIDKNAFFPPELVREFGQRE